MTMHGLANVKFVQQLQRTANNCRILISHTHVTPIHYWVIVESKVSASATVVLWGVTPCSLVCTSIYQCFLCMFEVSGVRVTRSRVHSCYLPSTGHCVITQETIKEMLMATATSKFK